MALKVGSTEVVDNNRQLKNIASIDSGTVTAFNSALNTDPQGTLTKTFAENETADLSITLSSNVTVGRSGCISYKRNSTAVRYINKG